jgi:hypothetical protein
VDQGLVSLDSEEDVEKYLPELGDLPVITGYNEDDTPILVKTDKKITLRMLMCHAAGEWIIIIEPEYCHLVLLLVSMLSQLFALA